MTFSPLKKFVSNLNRTIIVNGYETNMLVLEPLAKRLQAFFNCPTIEGAYLENQGSPGSIGSHFERRIFFNEVSFLY